MSGGRGKGSKGLGKGGAKRHPIVYKNTIEGIKKSDLLRIMRKSGIKRISQRIFVPIKSCMTEFLQAVLKKSLTYSEYLKRKTMTPQDVVHALKTYDIVLYGLNNDSTFQKRLKDFGTREEDSKYDPSVRKQGKSVRISKQHDDNDDTIRIQRELAERRSERNNRTQNINVTTNSDRSDNDQSDNDQSENF